MAKSVSPETQREYDQLKCFLIHWETHLTPNRVFEINHPYSPINMLAGFERKFGVSRALIGLKQAVNDVLETCEDFSPQQIAAADSSLAKSGASTITQLWQGRSRQYRAILRRGHLRSDTEYYLASSILADTASQVPSSERIALDDMVASYESKRA